LLVILTVRNPTASGRATRRLPQSLAPL